MNKVQMGFYAARLLSELTHHVGRHNAIGMGELYELVFQDPWANRINDTRKLRTVITELRKQGVAICSYCSSSSGGYYLASSGSSEMRDYLKRLRLRALKALVLEAKMRRIALPELLGQMQLELDGGYHEAA
jgi:hypothetical protein